MPIVYRKTPWPKRLNRIPKYVKDGLNHMQQNILIAAGVKKIPESSILRGDYSHLGISIVNNNIIYNPSIIPPDDMGKMSHANIHGYSKKRYDLPKVPKIFPLTGKDWRGNDVENSYSRPVYPVENYSAFNMDILVKLVHEEEFDGVKEYYIRFDVSRKLDKSDPDFDRYLIENLAFLRENTGIVSIYPDGTDDPTMINLTFTHWEFLPPGIELGALVKSFIGKSVISDDIKKELESRIKVLYEMQPGGGFVAGTKGLAGYIAARFGNDLTILENRNLGNAIYIIYNNWPAFSKMSRTEINNSGLTSDFERIEHRGDWVERLQRIVQAKRTDI